MSSAKDQKDDNPSARRGRTKTSASSEHPGTSVNMDELRELIALLRENGLAEFELEREGFRVRLRREGTFGPGMFPPELVQSPMNFMPASRSAAPTSPLAPSPAHPGAQAETAASEDQDLHIIPSPIVGTFYRSPSPTADA